MDPIAPRALPPSVLPRVVVLLLALGCVGYAIFLARYSASYAAGSDASGYFNSAQLLGEGRFQAPVRVPLGAGHVEFGLMTFQPLGFIVDQWEPRMAPTYPTGLPTPSLPPAALPPARGCTASPMRASPLLVLGFAACLIVRARRRSHRRAHAAGRAF